MRLLRIANKFNNDVRIPRESLRSLIRNADVDLNNLLATVGYFKAVCRASEFSLSQLHEIMLYMHIAGFIKFKLSTKETFEWVNRDIDDAIEIKSPVEKAESLVDLIADKGTPVYIGLKLMWARELRYIEANQKSYLPLIRCIIGLFTLKCDRSDYSVKLTRNDYTVQKMLDGLRITLKGVPRNKVKKILTDSSHSYRSKYKDKYKAVLPVLYPKKYTQDKYIIEYIERRST